MARKTASQVYYYPQSLVYTSVLYTYVNHKSVPLKGIRILEEGKKKLKETKSAIQ